MKPPLEARPESCVRRSTSQLHGTAGPGRYLAWFFVSLLANIMHPILRKHWAQDNALCTCVKLSSYHAIMKEYLLTNKVLKVFQKIEKYQELTLSKMLSKYLLKKKRLNFKFLTEISLILQTRIWRESAEMRCLLDKKAWQNILCGWMDDIINLPMGRFLKS